MGPRYTSSTVLPPPPPPALPDGEADSQVIGCKAAVEIVSRNSQKASYDIKKDGYAVATLTLVKGTLSARRDRARSSVTQ